MNYCTKHGTGFSDLEVEHEEREDKLYYIEFPVEGEKEGLVIGINTGAGGRWQDKKLPIEKTVELIDKLNSELKNELERIFYSRGIYVENVLLSEVASVDEFKRTAGE